MKTLNLLPRNICLLKGYIQEFDYPVVYSSRLFYGEIYILNKNGTFWSNGFYCLKDRNVCPFYKVYQESAADLEIIFELKNELEKIINFYLDRIPCNTCIHQQTYELKGTCNELYT